MLARGHHRLAVHKVVDADGTPLGRLTYIKSSGKKVASMSVLCEKHGCRACVSMSRGPSETGALAWLQLQRTRPGLTPSSHKAHFDALVFG